MAELKDRSGKYVFNLNAWDRNLNSFGKRLSPLGVAAVFGEADVIKLLLGLRDASGKARVDPNRVMVSCMVMRQLVSTDRVVSELDADGMGWDGM